MNAPNGNRRRVLSYEERVLWTAVTKAIAPLRASSLSRREAGERSEPDEGLQPSASRLPARPSGKRERAEVAAKVADKPPPLAPLGRRMRQRVARGKQPIDARIDLHGLTQAQAHADLLRFLRSAQAREARLVLVVTGKGSRDIGARGNGERGVLRRQVPHWLALPEFRSVVLGFQDAHVAHGGEGALYIWLRRMRGG